MVQAVQGQGGRDLKVGRVVEEVRSYLKRCETKVRCVFVVRFVSHLCVSTCASYLENRGPASYLENRGKPTRREELGGRSEAGGEGLNDRDSTCPFFSSPISTTATAPGVNHMTRGRTQGHSRG